MSIGYKIYGIGESVTKNFRTEPSIQSPNPLSLDYFSDGLFGGFDISIEMHFQLNPFGRIDYAGGDGGGND